ncbi:BsuPI-related putative proteinase inhibitor [Shewanella chilikensis]|uniref:BsuPI-related putative proteinase inhibitor n=1 Tax=Shewanella chilikensis TaxID=558541 RepID=UPI001F3F7D16|nr:BsuPI-related putative proteinase inhibitor [Shewanella chilikensis]MCE9787079.1 BsuPI-related putative proteinase inhibitor [Shewanella chilikensis]
MRTALPLVAVLLLAGCSGSNAAATEPMQKFPTGMEELRMSTLYFGTIKKAPTPALFDGKLTFSDVVDKQPLQVMLEIHNPKEYPIGIRFNSGMTADLWLLDDKEQRVWAWSDEMMFTQAIRDTSIKPGQTLKVMFKVPAKTLERIGPEGYSFQARFEGKPLESSVAAMAMLEVPVARR